MPTKKRAIFPSLYRKLASLKTAILLLTILIIGMVAGNFYPLFDSPIFLALIFVLFLNLVLCSFSTLLPLKRNKDRKGSQKKEEALFSVTLGDSEEKGDKLLGAIFEALGSLGYKRKVIYEGENEQKIFFERGISYPWINLLFHIGLILLFIGFFFSYLFSFEGEITIYPNREFVPIPQAKNYQESRWNRLLGKKEVFPRGMIRLKEFSTEYIPYSRLDYPKDAISRLGFAFMGTEGREKKAIKDKDKESSLSPDYYESSLEIGEKNNKIRNGRLTVNGPLRIKGLYLYQSGFEQDITLEIKRGGKRSILKTKTDMPFTIGGDKGKYLIDLIYIGKVHNLSNEKKESLIPFGNLYRDPKTKEPGKKLGRLTLGIPFDLESSKGEKRVSLRLLDVKEGSSIFYRYDPSLPLLSISSGFILFCLTIGLYGFWHELSLEIKKEEKSARGFLQSRGLLASKEKETQRIRNQLSLRMT